jgi:hypothetical protein
VLPLLLDCPVGDVMALGEEHPRDRIMILRKLRKAIRHAAELVALAGERGDSRTILEAEVRHSERKSGRQDL